MPRAPIAAALTLILTAALSAQPATPVITLRPHQQAAVAAPGPAPQWRESFGAAAAAAKERQVLLLLFFTAKW